MCLNYVYAHTSVNITVTWIDKTNIKTQESSEQMKSFMNLKLNF